MKRHSDCLQIPFLSTPSLPGHCINLDLLFFKLWPNSDKCLKRRWRFVAVASHEPGNQKFKTITLDSDEVHLKDALTDTKTITAPRIKASPKVMRF